MPPKARIGPGKASSSLVPTGKKEVFSKADPVRLHKPGEKKPSTEKALILRNGKYGARGTGELLLMKKLSGREKLDLLAGTLEDLIARTKQAVVAPFKLEECLKKAESQMDLYIDDIAHLREAELFFDLIDSELKARKEPSRDEPRRNSVYVARIIGTRIHNSYMLASAWRIVSEALNDLANRGLHDRNVKATLKSDEGMRKRYMFVYEMVQVLSEMSQNVLAVLATTTPHYAKYFKLKPLDLSVSHEPEYVFDWSDLRGAAKSFLDSIIIELCFPGSPYPKPILYQILHDAEEEAPREARRFSQPLMDAIGDLSRCVELQEMLEAPLVGEGAKWKQESSINTEEYETWVDAQIHSRKAADTVANFKDVIHPLERTRKQHVLDNMWKYINLNYQTVSGKTIDDLWNLSDKLAATPTWHAYKFSIPEESPPKPKKKLAITNGFDSEDVDSDEFRGMPDLQSISNSSEEESEGDFDSDSDYSEGYDTEEDSDFDEEAEDEIRDLLREAMDTAHEADFFDSGNNIPAEIDPFKQEDRKGNPFLKLLGSLRGRMFQASSKLKTPTPRAEARPQEARPPPVRTAFRATPSGAPKPVPTAKPPKPVPSTAQTPSTPAAQPKSQQATVEDVSSDGEGGSVSPKKKRKKKTKKRKSPSVGNATEMLAASLELAQLQSLVSEGPGPSVPKPTDTGSIPPSVKKSQAPAVVTQPPSSPKSVSLGGMTASESTTSLLTGAQFSTSHAQSAHSYLQTVGSSKEKVKSRPDHASLFSLEEEQDKKKGGLFSKLTGIGKSVENQDDMKEAKRSWFSNLSKKTSQLAQDLLGSGPEYKGSMKWENFLKIMREMGFSYDPSTAGSSVRFDPPDKRDKPITFHKPHPDPTLRGAVLQRYAKRLRRHYGWEVQDLLKYAEDTV